MNSPPGCLVRPLFFPSRRERLFFGADRLNPLLPEILAFWALWHCRHARPPDSASRSLSGLTVRSEGKAVVRHLGLRQFGCFSEANSWLFNEGKQQKCPSPAFPQ